MLSFVFVSSSMDRPKYQYHGLAKEIQGLSRTEMQALKVG